jgi:hypothetical protein
VPFKSSEGPRRRVLGVFFSDVLDKLSCGRCWRSGKRGLGCVRPSTGVGITNKRHRSEFIRRLAALDREVWSQRADVGGRGEQVCVSNRLSGGISMRRMKPKTCRMCSNVAHFSLACHLSTVGISPRSQKCSQVVLLCESCIRELCDCPPRDELRDALRDAYTTINRAPLEAPSKN